MGCQRPAKYFVLVLCVAAFAGCSYPISQQLRQEARKDLTFPMVLENPTNYIGSIVLWGGSIIETVTLTEGSEIFVLQTPLDHMEVPAASRHSQGRFIAKSSRFLDPEIYKNGRKITLAGEITGKETRPLGKSQYTYPVVAIKELHLWKKKKAYVYPYPSYFGWYYGPGWGWGLDWYGPGPYWPSWDDWDEEEED
ncbi:MAG: Slp family lipoprotein [Deltaproteobacteria bacterium]